MIIFITQKLLKREQGYIPTFISSSMDKLVKIHEKKKKLRKLIPYTLYILTTDPQYKEAVINYVKKAVRLLHLPLNC